MMPSRAVILALVRTLDLRMRQALSEGDEPTADFIQQVLARVAVATAEIAVQTTPSAIEGILAIRDAAHGYASDPSEAHWDEFSRAATRSYPFGPGAGCASGAGFIAHVGSDAAVLTVPTAMVRGRAHSLTCPSPTSSSQTMETSSTNCPAKLRVP